MGRADNSTMDPATREAFERLIAIALDDTQTSRRVSNFILAWWNAGAQGGFDPVDLCIVDQSIGDDILAVLTFLAKTPGGVVYPYEYRTQIDRLVQNWRSRSGA